MRQTNIKLIGCGGGGINASKYVSERVNNLGSGFSGIDVKYIDTSKSTTDNVFLIESIHRTEDEINGSGGLRATNAKSIVEGIKKFIDENNIRYKIGEYYFIMFTASSGSGSVAGPLLVKELMALNIPVVPIVIGDTSTALYAKNTLDTLATLNAIAKTPLCISYVNNSVYGNNTKQAIEKANDELFNIMSGFAVFLSGKNKDIDAKDMENILNLNNYNPKLNIKKGLYGIDIFNKDLIMKDYYIPIVGRTLCDSECEIENNIKLLHNKVGVITNENAKNLYKNETPIHMVTYANIFANEKKVITKIIEDYDNIMNSIVVDEVSSYSEADEDGLVL